MAVQESHTPGPWAQSHRQTGDDSYWTEVYLAADPAYVIASLHWAPRNLGNGHTTSDRDANARLISAAPDLLEALIQMEAEKADYMRINKLGDPAKEHTNKLARAAIAKATGAAQ